MIIKLFNSFIKHHKTPVNKQWRSNTIIFKMNSTDTNAIDINSLSPEEKKKILNIINYQDIKGLLEYSITKKHAQSLELHRASNGPYCSLEELLQIKDMNEKNLHKFYKSIISGKKKKNPRNIINGSVITSEVTNDDQKDVNTILGIHIGVDMISWSLLNRNCEVLQWNYKSFPQCKSTKENIHSLLQTTLSIAADFPKADRYIIEEFENNMFQKDAIAYKTHIKKSMRNAIIVSHLATLHSGFDINKFITNNVFTLHQNILRKIYGLVVGNEGISNQYVLQKLLDKSNGQLEDKTSLPTVHIKPEFQNMYNVQSGINKEQISWSLLLALAFVDIIVHERTDMKFRNPIYTESDSERPRKEDCNK